MAYLAKGRKFGEGACVAQGKKRLRMDDVAIPPSPVPPVSYVSLPCLTTWPQRFSYVLYWTWLRYLSCLLNCVVCVSDLYHVRNVSGAHVLGFSRDLGLVDYSVFHFFKRAWPRLMRRDRG